MILSKEHASTDVALARRVQWPPAVRITALLAPAAIALACCGSDPPRALRPPPGPPTGRIEIHQPERLTSIASDQRDALGRPLRVACVTCHSQRVPTTLPSTVTELDEFHQGLRFEHGALSCGSCHVAGDQRSLRRADGTMIDDVSHAERAEDVFVGRPKPADRPPRLVLRAIATRRLSFDLAACRAKRV